MLCSSSITSGLCTTIGLCTQTNKHRSSCVTERIRAILLSLTSDIWTGHWVYWGIYVCFFFFFGWAQLKCTFRFEVVRPSDRPFVRLSITFPVIQAWRVEREHVWLNDFYKLLLPFVCCYATINVWKCMQKARTYFATIAKKKENKTIGIRKNGITVL